MESVINEKSSVEEICTWLNSNGFEDYSQSFSDEGIDGEALSCLTERALESLVSRVGPRMKLLKMIEFMKCGGSQRDNQTWGVCPSPRLLSSLDGESSDSLSNSCSLSDFAGSAPPSSVRF